MTLLILVRPNLPLLRKRWKSILFVIVLALEVPLPLMSASKWRILNKQLPLPLIL